MNLNFTCNFKSCRKSPELPIILPCADHTKLSFEKAICSKHLCLFFTSDEKTSILCPLCDKKHQVPTSGFPALQIVEDFLYSAQGLNQKEANLAISELTHDIREAQKLAKDPLHFIDEYCRAIKDEIDLKAELEKNNIDLMRNTFIAKMNAFKKERGKALLKEQTFQLELDHFKKIIESFDLQCVEWNDKKFQLKQAANTEIWKNVLRECSDLKNELFSYKYNFEKRLLNHTRIIFEPHDIGPIGYLNQKRKFDWKRTKKQIQTKIQRYSVVHHLI